MRTFSSIKGRKVETHTGRTLGRCHDLRGELTGSKLRVTGICVGQASVALAPRDPQPPPARGRPMG